MNRTPLHWQQVECPLFAPSLGISSQSGNHLATGLAVHLVPLVPPAADDEPIHAGSAEETVDGRVVMDRRHSEAVGAVQAAAQAAVEVLDAGVVVGVGAAPLLHDGQ